MSSTDSDTGRRTRLYPTDHFLPGVAAVQRLVPPEHVDVLLHGPHPAFTRDRPPEVELEDEPFEGTDDIERYRVEVFDRELEAERADPRDGSEPEPLVIPTSGPAAPSATPPSFPVVPPNQGGNEEGAS